MVGIASVGVYIPMYRLNRKLLADMWGTKSVGGDKAVAGYDEDTITMAVAATLDCVKGIDRKVDGVFFATTTAPYKEKQSAAITASAVDLNRECHTGDFTNSLRAGTIAIKSAVDAVKSGSAKNVIVTASDCRMGVPRGRFEQLSGDGAAALMIGSDHPIANIEGSYSIFNDFTDLWRTERDTFVQSAEGRFVGEAGYIPTMKETITGLMKRYSFTPGDFSKIVFYAPDSREHAELAKCLGFDKAQVQEPLFSHIGNTGVAAALIMLAVSLEGTTPGNRILFVNYGDGCDAFILLATEEILRLHEKPMIKDRLAGKIPIDYGKYLNWRDLVPIEASTLPQRPEPSLPTRWRERKCISALYGVRCKRCGTPQLNPLGQTIRVCVACQSKDDFEDYKFSDKTGRLFSYAVDHLQPTKNPPGLSGVVDFEGGGRLICELTDYELDKVKIGMPVEMTFRKMYQTANINNYFWKAKPITY